MKVEVTRRFEKDLKRLLKSDAEQALESLERFIDHPKDPSLNFERVTNRAGYFSIRATFKIRILLRMTAIDEYDVVAIGNHDYIYKSYFR